MQILFWLSTICYLSGVGQYNNGNREIYMYIYHTYIIQLEVPVDKPEVALNVSSGVQIIRIK